MRGTSRATSHVVAILLPSELEAANIEMSARVRSRAALHQNEVFAFTGTSAHKMWPALEVEYQNYPVRRKAIGHSQGHSRILGI